MLLESNRVSAEEAQHPSQPGEVNRIDRFRRSKISAVEQISGRPLIIYASSCTTPAKPIHPAMLMLDSSDRIGFKSVTETIEPPNLDVLIHSPGGYAEATESIVQQLRGKYSDIRFIVPSYAKSAATMLAMSGNEILMDRDAELGPIDPQMGTQGGTSPAEAIKEQFEKAQAELRADPSNLPSWVPILAPLGPSLLVDAQHAIDLSKTLVKSWLQTYMFAGEPDAEAKATRISEFLGTHSNFLSHGRAVKIPELFPLGVKVTDLRSNPGLYAAVDELYCLLDILLSNSAVYKIFENSRGDALVRQAGIVQQVVQAPPPQRPTPTPAQPPPGSGPRHKKS